MNATKISDVMPCVMAEIDALVHRAWDEKGKGMPRMLRDIDFRCDDNSESVLEEIFGTRALRHFRPDLRIADQVWFATSVSNYRVDFVLYDSGRKIGIECDSRAWHEHTADCRRDAVLLSENHLDEIIRFDSIGILYHLEDVLYVVSRWHPELFSERGRICLGRLLSPEAADSLDEYQSKLGSRYVEMVYEVEPDSPFSSSAYVMRSQRTDASVAEYYRLARQIHA